MHLPSQLSKRSKLSKRSLNFQKSQLKSLNFPKRVMHLPSQLGQVMPLDLVTTLLASQPPNERSLNASHHHTAPKLAPSSPEDPCILWWDASLGCGASIDQSSKERVPFIIGCVFAAVALALYVWERWSSRAPPPLTREAAMPVKVEEPPAKVRIGWFDNAKLYALMFVALDHASIMGGAALSSGAPAILYETNFGSCKGILAAFGGPTMPLFFLMAGVVAKPELTGKAMLGNVIGLILPAVLVGSVKAFFLSVSVLDWRLGSACPAPLSSLTIKQQSASQRVSIRVLTRQHTLKSVDKTAIPPRPGCLP